MLQGTRTDRVTQHSLWNHPNCNVAQWSKVHCKQFVKNSLHHASHVLLSRSSGAQQGLQAEPTMHLLRTKSAGKTVVRSSKLKLTIAIITIIDTSLADCDALN